MIPRRGALLGLSGALAAPGLSLAQGQVRMTLGHATAPGNPRYVATERSPRC